LVGLAVGLLVESWLPRSGDVERGETKKEGIQEKRMKEIERKDDHGIDEVGEGLAMDESY